MLTMVEANDRMLAGSQVSDRQVELASGRRVHILERGEGPPLVLLHGTGTSSLSWLPLLEPLSGVRAIAVDRPGFGLSEPLRVPRERFRAAAIEFVDQVLDELDLESATLAGASMGGTWALWYALARPERVHGITLLGAPPLLPGTRVPPPLRLMAMPLLGDVLARFPRPTPKAVVRFLSSMGEGDTIVRYPDLIQAQVSAGKDPLASATSLAEFRAALSPLGFRGSMRLREQELQRLTLPTLLLFGDHDPVASVETARTIAGLLPDAQLEILPGGHVPYFGSPERSAELVSAFVRAWPAARLGHAPPE
jgi:pimeloyl-ACP methyl ester carboxylesterase